jgi:hypothetical protein
MTTVTELNEPIRFDRRAFPMGCEIKVTSLAPRGLGVELASLVGALRVFPDKASWSAWMRRTLLPLVEADVKVIRPRLAGVKAPTPEIVATYVHRVDAPGR